MSGISPPGAIGKINVDKIVLKTDGTKNAPAFSFKSDPDTGIFLQAPNILSFVAGGREGIRVDTRSNAINCFLFSPSIAGVGPTISTDGTDTNIDLIIDPKGTGKTQIKSDLTVDGNLTVDGTTTTINSTTLTVDDKNIELASTASPTDVLADGGGITLRGTTNKTITWIDATKAWTFNEDIDALTNIIRTTGVVTGGFVIGTTSVFGGNLLLSGNTLSSANANGDILLVPNGTGKVEVLSVFQVSSGGPGAGKVLTSDATGIASWTLPAGQVVVQETFASSNVRFFGELALPAAQGWTDTATGIATIDLVTQTVFGEVKQVVRHNDDTGGGATTSEIILTAQNWIDINLFGASYSGTARLDTVDGVNGFFSCLQANAAENPLATGNRRYGIQFNSNAGNLRLTESDNTGNNVTMDGTGGNPLITFDEWFSWECVIPAGLGAAEFYINGILTTFVPVFGVNGGGLGTSIKVGSGSTGGANRIVYHDNFGVTIYEESATKTLAAATMVGDVAQINIPEGKRDYTIVLPDGNPRAIGAVLRLVVNNLGGLISLENQNPAAPEILYNGLRTLVINVAVKETIEGINTVSSGNVYLGFQTGDIDRTKSIFVQLSSSVNQDPADTNPTVITFDTQDAIAGITHSTTVNSGEITVVTEGVYFVSPQPQVGKTSGATKTDFDVFLQVDRGSGFVDEPNSNIKLTIKDSDITDVAIKALGISLNVGDKIRLMQRVSSSTVVMGLKATAAETGPPTIPATPAIILDMHRIGGI